MTNCHSTRHPGPKIEKDLSICLGTFRGITAENWIKMCSITGMSLEENVLIHTNEKREPSKQELRDLRLAYYSPKT